jgi:transposase-like protein
MDITDFDRMEYEASERWADEMMNSCPLCRKQMEDRKSIKYGEYKYCSSCKKNWQLKT